MKKLKWNKQKNPKVQKCKNHKSLQVPKYNKQSEKNETEKFK